MSDAEYLPKTDEHLLGNDSSQTAIGVSNRIVSSVAKAAFLARAQAKSFLECESVRLNAKIEKNFDNPSRAFASALWLANVKVDTNLFAVPAAALTIGPALYGAVIEEARRII